MALHVASAIHPPGRIKDGDKWFTFTYSKNGTETPRDFFLRYQGGLLICEKDENDGGGRTIASPTYLGNFPDLAFVQSSKDLFATEAQLTSKGINANGPVNQAPTSKEIPYEISDATGKIAAKALPTDAGEEVKKATEVVQTLANNIAGGGSTSGGGSTAAAGSATSMRNILGWVLVAAGVGLVIGLVVWGVKKMNKKKR